MPLARARLLLVFMLALAGLLPVAGPPTPAHAGTIQVTTTGDELGTGAGCSLREAIQSANQGSGFGGCSGATLGGSVITDHPRH